MIISKIIILYFIQIRHTDDFPLNGYPSSLYKDLIILLNFVPVSHSHKCLISDISLLFALTQF